MTKNMAVADHTKHMHTEENVTALDELVLSREDQQTYHSACQTAQSAVIRWSVNLCDLGLTYLKICL